MKSILYVGATLMIGASIYGFVDYKQTSQKKEFKSMYSEKKAIEPVVFTDVETLYPVVKTEVTKQTKTAVEKKKNVIALEEEYVFLAIKPIPIDQKLTSEDKDIILTEEVTVVPKENNVVKIKKKRKISTKLFSRAPLKENYDNEELPATSKKKELKQLEIKE
ncbi:MAG: hypothetical protein ABIP79_12420 [Chitinophagaceae bacterium]